MQSYDWKRFARLLRIDRPDCWDREDIDRPLWERVSPYRLESDGVYLPDLALSDAPNGLCLAEIEALHPGPSGKVLALPATLPDIVTFLKSSGEYARLPGRLWPRLQRLTASAAAFSRAWHGIDSHALAFDPKAVRRERFIPLKILFSWLEKLPAPRESEPELQLLDLAKRHVETGHLQTHGPTWRFIPETFDHDPRPIDVGVMDKGVISRQVTRLADVVGPLPDDPDNPLIDAYEFATWFREVSPEYLRLPVGFPGAETEAEAEVETVTIGVPLEEPKEWPTIQVLAAAYDGLNGWDEDQWQSNLGGGNRSPWIMDHLKRPGRGGRGQFIRAHPVGLALGIVDKATEVERQVVLSRLDAVFTRGELAAWRPHWMAARPKTIRP